MEGGGFGFMDLDQIIYVHTVTRRKAVGGYFARGHRREDLGVGREPLANAMSLPATRPTDTSPVRVGKSFFCIEQSFL